MARPSCPRREGRRVAIDAAQVLTVIAVVSFHAAMTVGGGPAGASSAMAVLIWLTAVMQNEVIVMLALCLAYLRPAPFQRQRLIVKALQVYALATVGFILFDVVAGVRFPWPEGFRDVAVLILAGSTAYHLHFFPALVVLVLLTPRSAPKMALGIDVGTGHRRCNGACSDRAGNPAELDDLGYHFDPSPP